MYTLLRISNHRFVAAKRTAEVDIAKIKLP